MLFPVLKKIVDSSGNAIDIESKNDVHQSLLLDEEQANGASDTGMGILERTVK